MKKKKKIKTFGLTRYFYLVFQIYHNIIAFFKWNNISYITKEMSTKIKNKKLKSKINYEINKNMLKLIKNMSKVIKNFKKKYHFKKNKKNKKFHKLFYKCFLKNSNQIGKGLFNSLTFFNRLFSYTYHEGSKKYYLSWFKGWSSIINAYKFNYNKLILYIFEIYKFMLYFYKLKKKENKNKISKKYLAQYTEGIFYYLDKFYRKFRTVFNRCNSLSDNRNYFCYSFTLKKLKYKQKKNINIMKSFNIIYLFNNIIYKFIFFLNMYWINLHSYNNININYSNYFYDIKKKFLIMHRMFSTFTIRKGRRGQWKEKKWNHLPYINANKLYLYAKNVNINSLQI